MDLRLRVMKTFSESTNQGNPSNGNPSPFQAFGNIGAPYMTTLSLTIFMIILPVWLFSTSLVLNIPATSQPSYPPQQNQPHVDLFPYSPTISTPFLLLVFGKALILVIKKLRRRRSEISRVKPTKHCYECGYW